MSRKADIWMPLYIGDYLADTSHLDAESSGAYLHLLMHYWRKGPISKDVASLASIAKLRGKNAQSIVQALLSEFFTEDGDGLMHQKRQDHERTKWQQRNAVATVRASKAAAARWGDALSIACSSASSITVSIPTSKQQALLNTCPLPLPLPLPLSSSPPGERPPTPQVVAPKAAQPPYDPSADPLENIPEGLALLQYAGFVAEQVGIPAGYALKVKIGDTLSIMASGGPTAPAARDLIQRMKAAGPQKWLFWLEDGGWKDDAGRNATEAAFLGGST